MKVAFIAGTVYAFGYHSEEGITCENPGAVAIPVDGIEVYERVTTTCDLVQAAYEQECCDGEGTFDPYLLGGGDIFAEPGSHISHAETFSGTKIQSLITASECTPALPEHAWQADPRQPDNKFCAFGAFDGLQAMPVSGGAMQSLAGTYMRTFTNTEITGAPNSPNTPTWFVSTVEDKGGFGQIAPNDDEKLQFWGATEFFVDYDRSTLVAVNGGHAIKRIYTANMVEFNAMFDSSLKAVDIFGIVTSYSELHNNVQPSFTERYHPDCSETSDARSCGLNGHCGSKLALKHEFSYNVTEGVPAYGSSSGVGFEDDLIFIAEEGHPLGGWSSTSAILGTVQVLDVATGNLYQLPHLSVGVIEMAFSISTGHPDYVAVGMEEYGVTEFDGVDGGSRWNVWIGKKDLTSSNFLDRNGLAPNCGRVYVYAADDGTVDMADYLEWPQSGHPDYVLPVKTGAFKPIDGMFDGRYSHWHAGLVNTLNTTDGSVPVHMTRRGKQEWGAVNPEAPNQWAIAETGLGGSTGGRANGCENATADCEMGTESSTVAFLEADFLAGFMAADGSVTSRDGTTFPQSIPAQVNGVMADQVYNGPFRAGQRGLAAVDSLYWLKGNKLLAAEDSYGPGGFNMGIMYDVASRQSVPIIGAISRYGSTLRKMNAAAMAPYGSFSGTVNQEMTGFYDASAALTLDVPYTPQELFDAYDAKHVIVNNQMKGSAGPMTQGFWYTAQTHLLELPDIDFDTFETSPTELNTTDEALWVTMYGRFRGRRLDEPEAFAKFITPPNDHLDDWSNGHDDFNTNLH